MNLEYQLLAAGFDSNRTWRNTRTEHLLQLLCLKIHWVMCLAIDMKPNFW